MLVVLKTVILDDGVLKCCEGAGACVHPLAGHQERGRRAKLAHVQNLTTPSTAPAAHASLGCFASAHTAHARARNVGDEPEPLAMPCLLDTRAARLSLALTVDAWAGPGRAPAVTSTWSARRNRTDVTEKCEVERPSLRLRGVRSHSSCGTCASCSAAALSTYRSTRLALARRSRVHAHTPAREVVPHVCFEDNITGWSSSGSQLHAGMQG